MSVETNYSITLNKKEMRLGILKYLYLAPAGLGKIMSLIFCSIGEV